MSEVLEQYGPYTRVRRLGAGGMAETFLAVQRGGAGFEQRVCMKFILPAHRENPDFRRLFLREASIAASLRHSNIVGVIDVNEEAAYLVLELVDGVDLRALINAAPNRRLSVEMATLIAIELCKALAYAHGRKRRGLPDGVVHRDVSASNVLISYAGEVKLTDFGVARAMRQDAEPLSTTVKGKLCYMSPEQARGLVVDGRSDLFSLGVLFYELVSGQRPFDGATDADTLLRITAGQHRSLLELAPDVPAGVAEVVERMLYRDREQRFVSADACIDALAPFAPKATMFRELGDFARATRPHQTLPSYEVLELARTLPSKTNGLNATQTQGLPERLATARPASDAGARNAAGFAATGFGRALRHVPANAWRALGVSVLVLLGVASAWTARIAREQNEALSAARPLERLDTGANSRAAAAATGTHVADVRSAGTTPPTTALAPATSTPPTPTTPATNAAPTTFATPTPQAPEAHAGDRTNSARPRDALARDATELSENASRALTTAVNDEPLDSGRGTARRQPTAAGRTHSPGSDEEQAMLHIGVVPMGQVWIDGQPAGWTPVDAKLSPGRHSIGAGETRQELKRYVRVRAGEERQLVLNLDEEARGYNGQSEATSQLSDR
jgi:serine/threonine protein kinase